MEQRGVVLVSSTPARPPAPEPTTSGPGPTISPEHHTRRSYEVRHRTTYTYEEYVTDSFGRALLRPRETGQQRVLEHRVEICLLYTSPSPRDS